MSLRASLLFTCVITTALCAYIVKEGDTLWDISDTFFKDPFEWPYIWENNQHIKNPHLIYPGDSLTLDGKPQKAAPTLESIAEKKDVSVREESFGSTPDDSYNDDTGADSLPKYMTYSGRGIKERLREDFVNKIGTLGNSYMEQEDNIAALKSDIPDTLAYRPKPRILKTIIQQQAPYLVETYSEYKTFRNEFRIQRESKSTGNTIKIDEEFIITAGKNDGIALGDTIEIFSHSDEKVMMRTHEKSETQYRTVTPQALAVVKAVGEKNSRALLFRTFGVISEDKSRARPYQKRLIRIVNTFVAVEKVDLKEVATIGHLYGESDFLKYYSWVAINKGTSQGYRPGDIIQVLENSREDKTLQPRVIATGIIIVSEPHTASVLIHNIFYSARTIALKDHVVITHKAID